MSSKEVNLSLAISSLSNLLGSLRDAGYFAREVEIALCESDSEDLPGELMALREKVLKRRRELIDRRSEESLAKLQREKEGESDGS